MKLYGLERFPFGKLTLYRGTLNWDQFASGDYILVSPAQITDDLTESAASAYYQPGERVPITWPDGTVKEYEVMAVAGVPYALGPGYGYFFGCDFILPAGEYLAHAESSGALRACFDVDDAHEEQTQQWIEAYTERSALSYESKATFEETFQNMVDVMAGVGGAVVLILSLIGVLNFINATATSIVTRRRELAMLQSVGMTGGQLSGMLIGEGMLHILISLALTASLGSLLCYGLVRFLTGQMWYFTYHFTLRPMLLCAPALVGLAALVPWIGYRFLCRDSMVERLREAE